MRIILHFGMHKTGSTSIQNSFFNNAGLLEHLLYPDFGTHSHNPLLSNLYGRKAAKAPSPEIAKRKKINAKTKLKTALDTNLEKNDDILISAEVLSAFNIKQLNKLYSLLSTYAKEIIAVGYIRSPKSYIESAFQETLKGGNIKRLDLTKRYPNYQERIQKFDLILGQENVFLWKFNPSAFPDGCVVRDFCQRLNINLPAESMVRVNESLSLGAVSLLYAYSKFKSKLKIIDDHRKSQKLFIKNVSDYQDGKKLHFASSLILPILEQHKLDLEWMEARLGESLAENIYLHDDQAIASESDLLKFDPACTQWLASQLGDDYAKNWHPDMSGLQIAEWMHLLRIKANL